MLERKSRLVNKAFNQYFWASVLTVAATQIAGIVDAAIVGNLIGADGLAAVNLSKPLLQAFFAVSCLYVPSCTILAGMAIGRGDRKAADKLFSISLEISLLLGVVFTVAGILFFGPISGLLCKSDTLRPLSDDFMQVTLLSPIPQLLMLNLHQFVSTDGEPKMVTRAVIIGQMVNILLDIVFIKVFSWGIRGAALATCIMYVISIIMVLPHFRKKNTLRIRPAMPREVEIGKVFSIGLPLFFSTVLLSVQYIGNNFVASKYLGDDGLVALAVCIQLLSFSMIILTGTLRTIQPVGSILKGLGDSKGLLLLMKRGYSIMIASFAVLAAIIILFPVQIGSMLGVSSASGLEMVRKALPLFSLNIVFQGLIYTLLPSFQLYDRKELSLVMSVLQSLLPMVFFLLLRGSWIGFFTGQAVVAAVVLVWGMVLRHKDSSLSRILLIPIKDDTEVLDISMDISTASLSEAVTALRSFLSSNGKDSHAVNVAAICTEEFAGNIIRHGNATSIDLAATVNGDTISISIHDDGMAFNPVEAVKSSDSRIGLGLIIAKAFCKDLDYKYLFNQNMLKISIVQ